MKHLLTLIAALVPGVLPGATYYVDASRQDDAGPAWQYAVGGIMSIKLIVSNATPEAAECIRTNYVTVVPEPPGVLVAAGVGLIVAGVRRWRRLFGMRKRSSRF